MLLSCVCAPIDALYSLSAWGLLAANEPARVFFKFLFLKALEHSSHCFTTHKPTLALTLSERASSYHPNGLVIIRFAKNINDRLMIHYMEINVEEIKPIRMAFVRFVTIRGS